MAVRYGKPVACGAYTPTEALTAHEAGADFIKLFPADGLGPKYIQNILLGPLPMLRIIPTGGVTVETAGDFLKAGCAALGAGSSLIAKEFLKKQGLGRADGACEGVRRSRLTKRGDKLLPSGRWLGFPILRAMIGDIRKLLESQPFLPFTINMADGRRNPRSNPGSCCTCASTRSRDVRRYNFLGHASWFADERVDR